MHIGEHGKILHLDACVSDEACIPTSPRAKATWGTMPFAWFYPALLPFAIWLHHRDWSYNQNVQECFLYVLYVAISNIVYKRLVPTSINTVNFLGATIKIKMLGWISIHFVLRSSCLFKIHCDLVGIELDLADRHLKLRCWLAIVIQLVGAIVHNPISLGGQVRN